MPLKSDITELNRRDNARALADQCKSKAEFARRINRNPGQMNQSIGPNPTKNIGGDLAREIEQAFHKPAGWLDQNHSSTEAQDLDADMYAMAEGLPREALIEYLAVAAAILSGPDQLLLIEKLARNARESLS